MIESASTDTTALAEAITDFEVKLPGWWWSVCHCALTRDASCGPDFRVLGEDHPHVQMFDAGFDTAIEGTLAEALREVTTEALSAIERGEPLASSERLRAI